MCAADLHGISRRASAPRETCAKMDKRLPRTCAESIHIELGDVACLQHRASRASSRCGGHSGAGCSTVLRIAGSSADRPPPRSGSSGQPTSGARSAACCMSSSRVVGRHLWILLRDLHLCCAGPACQDGILLHESGKGLFKSCRALLSAPRYVVQNFNTRNVYTLQPCLARVVALAGVQGAASALAQAAGSSTGSSAGSSPQLSGRRLSTPSEASCS